MQFFYIENMFFFLLICVLLLVFLLLCVNVGLFAFAVTVGACANCALVREFACVFLFRVARARASEEQKAFRQKDIQTKCDGGATKMLKSIAAARIFARIDFRMPFAFGPTIETRAKYT